VNRDSRIPAFLAYLLSIIGWLYVLFFHRRNAYAIFHVKQSVGILLFAVGVTIGWLILGWLLAWIPFGGVFMMSLFSLVIAAYLFSLVIWIMGMARALTDQHQPLPLIGVWADNLPLERFFH
jgi:uncharacterized membrane protein